MYLLTLAKLDITYLHPLPITVFSGTLQVVDGEISSVRVMYDNSNYASKTFQVVTS